MRILIIAPTNFQSYAAAVFVKLIKDPNIKVVGVLVHAFNLSRFKNEFKRDGKRIFYKVLNKAILNEKRSLKYSFETPKRYLVQSGIKPNLKSLCDLNHIYYKKVSSFNNVNLIDDLKNLKIDIGAFCGGGLLRNKFLDSFSFGVLNCHMGVLPNYRGMDVVEWPILNGDFNSVGLTTHFMDSGIDTGPILKIKRIKIRKNENINILRKRFEPLMVELMLSTVIDFSTKKIKPVNQNFEDGKQYYIMHNDLKEICKKKLENII